MRNKSEVRKFIITGLWQANYKQYYYLRQQRSVLNMGAYYKTFKRNLFLIWKYRSMIQKLADTTIIECVNNSQGKSEFSWSGIILWQFYKSMQCIKSWKKLLQCNNSVNWEDLQAQKYGGIKIRNYFGCLYI